MSFENANFGGVGWSVEQLRLMTKIAVLYHEEGVKQPEISQRLNLSQARVSRYLNQAAAAGIVRTAIVQPYGIYVGLEKALEEKYKLKEVVVVENIEGAALKSSHLVLLLQLIWKQPCLQMITLEFHHGVKHFYQWLKPCDLVREK